MDRHGAALVLEEIATLLDSTGENRFKVRAFRTAARALDRAEGDLRELVASGRLMQLPGIGAATARIIEELVVTGEARYHMELRERAPSGMRALLRVPGLGAKKIALLHEQLGIHDLDTLEAAVRSGRIAAVRGFGARSAERILDGLAFARGLAGRRRYHQAEEAALRLAGFMEALPGVDEAVVAGELRRGLEIVDRIVIVATTTQPASTAAALRGAAGVEWTQGTAELVHGRFGDALSVDVHLCAPVAAGAALLFATGPAQHADALARAAAERGVELAAGGVRRAGDRIAATEAALYEMLELQWVPPELRDRADSIELARARRLPRLIEPEDLRGCFHCHTTYSDGTAGVAEMAVGALELGWRYLGIADHSKNAGYAGGLSTAQIRRQQREIAQWNRARGSELRLFSGIEADILADGTLDYADEPAVLDSFDYVIGSVHSQFRMDRDSMTQRMRRAVGDPRLTILGHPTGRLLLTREGYAVDVDAVIDAAGRSGAVIEINADPHRLDLSWQHWPAARAAGVMCAINPDAHSVNGMRNVRYGVVMARRGGLAAHAVINTWPVERLTEYLEERKRRRVETN